MRDSRCCVASRDESVACVCAGASGVSHKYEGTMKPNEIVIRLGECHTRLPISGEIIACQLLADGYSGEPGTVLCLGCVVLARALLSVRSSVDDLVVGSALFKEHTVRAVPCISPLTGLR